MLWRYKIISSSVLMAQKKKTFSLDIFPATAEIKAIAANVNNHHMNSALGKMR